MRTIAMILMLAVCTLLLAATCGCEHNSDTPIDQPIWFIEMPGTISSNEIITIRFGWRITENLRTHAALRFYENASPGGGVVAYSPMISLYEGSGENIIIWNGRKNSPGGRTIPAPLGSHHVDIIVTSSYVSARRPITVIANGFDTDGDDISDAVEDENNGVTGMQTPIIDENGNTQYGWFVSTNGSLPPAIPTTISSSNLLYPNRGTHDFSIAQGTRGGGCLHNGLRIANQGSGYRYFPNTDPADYDNWATLMLINEVERTGRQWNASYPTYPMTTLDMSLAAGGSFPPHTGHQNGLDVDIMYVGTGVYQYGVFVLITDTNYDQPRSQQLMQTFDALPTVYRIWTSDEVIANISTTDKIQFQTNHVNHFHVDFIDPDGNQSCQ
jgi:hypothetical protein